MSTENQNSFPVLYGRRIKNTADFMQANLAALSDFAAGRISVKEANAINRQAREILKMFRAVIRARKIAGAA